MNTKEGDPMMLTPAEMARQVFALDEVVTFHDLAHLLFREFGLNEFVAVAFISAAEVDGWDFDPSARVSLKALTAVFTVLQTVEEILLNETMKEPYN